MTLGFFNPTRGNDPNLTNLFQMGWNHQQFMILKSNNSSFWGREPLELGPNQHLPPRPSPDNGDLLENQELVFRACLVRLWVWSLEYFGKGDSKWKNSQVAATWVGFPRFLGLNDWNATQCMASRYHHGIPSEVSASLSLKTIIFCSPFCFAGEAQSV